MRNPILHHNVILLINVTTLNAVYGHEHAPQVAPWKQRMFCEGESVNMLHVKYKLYLAVYLYSSEATRSTHRQLPACLTLALYNWQEPANAADIRHAETRRAD